MTFGSLFAGIGGIDLGLERVGMKCIWQVENNPYAIKILEKHWPNIHREIDVKECGKHNLEEVDLICGGFPCQDLSYAGKRAGIEGSRSGLWFEFARIVRELRPRYVLVENVPGLLSAGMGRVLGDLAESGYDAEWNRVSAASVGAPHLRERIFIVGYTKHNGCPTAKISRGTKERGGNSKTGEEQTSEPAGSSEQYGNLDRDTDSGNGHEGQIKEMARRENTESTRICEDVADTEGGGCTGGAKFQCDQEENRRGRGCNVVESCKTFLKIVADTTEQRLEREVAESEFSRRESGLLAKCSWWAVEPNVGRVAHGVPHRVDRLKCLGNAVVPQVAEFVGRCIMKRIGQMGLGI